MIAHVTVQERSLEVRRGAITLIYTVHTHDEQLLATTYSSRDLPGLLAALVDTDRGLRDLLERVDRPTVPAVLRDPRDGGPSHHSIAVHGSRNRYRAGWRGAGCGCAENTHQRDRRRQRSATAKAADG